jgi:PAS domain S-box-containing protein
MFEWLKEVFSPDGGFMPHVHCYLSRPPLVWTMFVTDVMIGAAYLAISIILWALVRRVKLAFDLVVVCFSVFILFCGLTHWLEVWTLWNPDYWLAAGVKTVTAAASVGTGMYLFRLRHPIVTVAEAAKLSEQRRLDLEALTRDLEERVEERTREAREGEARFRETFECIAIGMAHVGLDGRWIRVNTRLCLITGHSEAELRAMTFMQITHPDDVARDVETLEQVRSGRIASTSLETRYYRKDGALIWVEVTVTVSRDAAGAVRYFIVSVEDISRRKALQLERERLYELPTHLLCVLDGEGRFKDVNRGLTNILGYEREELIGRPIWELIHPDDVEKSRRAEQEGRAGLVEAFENRYRAKDGSWRWLRWSGRIVEGLNYGAAVDITDIRLAEEQLRQSEEQFRSLASSIPQLAWIARSDGHIFWYNRRWYEYTGTDPAAMEGWGWQSVHHPQELPRVLERWKQSMATGAPFDMEFPLRGANGAYRWFLTRVEPVRDSSGRVVRWFGTNTDIEEERRTREELKAALQLRDEFLSIASHELKTPLTPLKLQVQNVLRFTRRTDAPVIPKEPVQQMGDDLERYVRRLTLLVDDLLDVSRIRAGKMRLEVGLIDVSAMVAELIQRYEPQLRGAGCAVHREIEPSVEAFLDRQRLEQILANLINNVVKYAPGEPVYFRLRRSGQRLRIEVEDRGPGVPEKERQAIFQRFERAGADSSKVSGLGLGLYIARQIVEAHDGRISVEPAGERGSRFVVELPLDTRRASPSHVV